MAQLFSNTDKEKLEKDGKLVQVATSYIASFYPSKSGKSYSGIVGDKVLVVPSELFKSIINGTQQADEISFVQQDSSKYKGKDGVERMQYRMLELTNDVAQAEKELRLKTIAHQASQVGLVE